MLFVCQRSLFLISCHCSNFFTYIRVDSLKPLIGEKHNIRESVGIGAHIEEGLDDLE